MLTITQVCLLIAALLIMVFGMLISIIKNDPLFCLISLTAHLGGLFVVSEHTLLPWYKYLFSVLPLHHSVLNSVLAVSAVGMGSVLLGVVTMFVISFLSVPISLTVLTVADLINRKQEPGFNIQGIKG